MTTGFALAAEKYVIKFHATPQRVRDGQPITPRGVTFLPDGSFVANVIIRPGRTTLTADTVSRVLTTHYGDMLGDITPLVALDAVTGGIAAEWTN